MATCETIGRKKVSVCTGDLRWRVDIVTRGLAPPSGNSVDFIEGFIPVATVWAMVQPVKPFSTLNSVSVEKEPTHMFIIRYRNDVTSENFIVHDNKYYDIVRMDDLDSTKSYLRLYALETGSTTKEASKIGVRP